ncbi:MAG TPA: sigma-70 family RNA polymerase sigma factor [Planctomycetota bacterium]
MKPAAVFEPRPLTRDEAERLLEACGPGLRAMAQSWLGISADAEDVVQETFLKALANLGTYRPVAPFEHWVFTIAANVIRAQGRRDRRPLPAPEVEAPPSPDDALDRAEDLVRIARAVESLDPLYRAPFLLRLRHGFEPAKIAELLGLPVEHVRVRLHRAIRKIRDLVRSRP